MEAVLDLLGLPLADLEGEEGDSSGDEEQMAIASPRASNEDKDGSTVSQRVMSLVEGHASKLLPGPLNSVASDLGTGGVPTALLEAPHDCYVARTTVGEGHRARAVLIGVIRRPDESGHQATLGWVRVMRSASLPSTFSSLEVQRLSHLCEVCSIAYAAMKSGLDSPRAPGNVQALMLPALMRAAPILLGPKSAPSHAAAAGSSASASTPASGPALSPLHELSVLFKHLCGGGGPHKLHRSPFVNAVSEEGAAEELFVSSEDPQTGLVSDFTSIFADDTKSSMVLDRALADSSSVRVGSLPRRSGDGSSGESSDGDDADERGGGGGGGGGGVRGADSSADQGPPW